MLYWTRSIFAIGPIFSEEREEKFLLAAGQVCSKVAAIWENCRDAPVAQWVKKFLEGRLSAGAAGICARARAAKQKGSHMGIVSGGAAMRAVRVVQVAQKECDFGKKDCAI